jgi:serine/threonine protein kinase
MENLQKGQCPVCDTVINFSDSEPLASVECSNCKATLVVPWIFGRFQLTEKEESEFRFFEFYLGYDSKLDKNIRLGILKKDIDEYDYWLDTCKNEGKFLKTLEHVNIVTVLDYGMEAGYFYYIEECLEGFSIEEYDPNKVGELEVQSVIMFCKKLALALDAIHHKEFVHHKVEPQNIFIEKSGELKVINLFPSRIEYAHDEKKGMKEFFVSPYYISPEKAEKGKEDRKGDVFSLGVFLYYYLTGDYPYNGDTEEEIIFSRVKRKKTEDHIITQIGYLVPNPITNYRGEEIREKVAELIERLIKPYPIQRPTAGEFVSELKLIDAEEDRIEAEKKRRHFLDNTRTVKIPTMEKLSRD